jgi:hypothetical protein
MAEQVNVLKVEQKPQDRFEEDLEFLRDNDSLYVLPLKFLPLETGMIRRCKLVKTFNLRPAVEMFRLSTHGRGYFLIEDLVEGSTGDMFGWQDDFKDHPDFALLELLGELHSYDIFNLRIKFRQHNIVYEDNDYLTLSDEMKSELQFYMRQFTMPLIRTIFGDGAAEEHSDGDIVQLFRGPAAADAQKNIEMMAEKLRIERTELPNFLDEFSDIYMAISYYKLYADRIGIMNSIFMSELDDIRDTLKWKGDPAVENYCNNTKEILKSLFLEVFQRLDLFERDTRNFWEDLDASRFRDVMWMVKDSQEMIAGVLCGLGTKLSGWREKFPNPELGGAAKRYESLRYEFCPGLPGLLELAAADT